MEGKAAGEEISSDGEEGKRNVMMCNPRREIKKMGSKQDSIAELHMITPVVANGWECLTPTVVGQPVSPEFGFDAVFEEGVQGLHNMWFCVLDLNFWHIRCPFFS